jgi:hypothetical protein
MTLGTLGWLRIVSALARARFRFLTESAEPRTGRSGRERGVGYFTLFLA